MFIYKLTEVKFCMSVRKYHDVTLTANDAASCIYTMFTNPYKVFFDSYVTKIFTNQSFDEHLESQKINILIKKYHKGPFSATRIICW